jgi:MT0933-like antitoxin protein
MVDFDDVKDFASKHDEQVDQGLEKAGGAAGERFGHQEQIDSAVDKAQGAVGGDNPK